MEAVQDAAADTMAPESRVRVTREGWWIDGRRRIILCASLFYFRVPKDLWADRLERAAQAGYHAIDVYIPWNYHEPERGALSFENDRDVRAFLRLARDAGMYVIARPGPYICSEWDGGALPAWLYPAYSRAETDPRSNTTFHSGHRTLRQADPSFLAEVSRWYDAVFPILREEQIDAGGAVLAVQIDNELDFYPCADPRAYLSFLKEAALAHGITVPLLACSGEDGVSKATGDLDGVTPTANIYSRYRAPELEARARRVKAQLEQRGAPLTITETDRNHFTLRRLLSVGAKFLGPYLQVSAHHTGYFAGQNNWGKPSTFLQSDYDFGGMVGPDGELRDEFYDGRVMSGFIAAFERELATSEAGTAKVKLRSSEQPMMDAATLVSSLGGRFVFIPNLGDRPLEAIAPLAVTPHRVGVVTCDIDFAPRGVPVKLASCNAEIARACAVEGGLIIVVAYDPLEDVQDAAAIERVADVELVFETQSDAVVRTTWGDLNVEAIASSAGEVRVRIALSPRNRADDELAAAVIDAGGARLTALLAPRRLAARTWEIAGDSPLKIDTKDVLHLGWDWVSRDGRNAHRRHDRRVYRVSEKGGIAEVQGDALAKRTLPTRLPVLAAEWYIPHEKPGPLALMQIVPADARWQGEARYLETLGVHYGAAYYRFNVNMDDRSGSDQGLWINGASDAVCVYINETYLGTALPRGRSLLIVGDLPWRGGENEVIVRTEIMGHSNFHDTTTPVTHLGSMRGLAGPVVLSHRSPGAHDYARHVKDDPLPSRNPRFIYGARRPDGRSIEPTWELWRATSLEVSTPPPSSTDPHRFPVTIDPGATTEILVPLPERHPDVPLWARLIGHGAMGELWIDQRLVGRFWLGDDPDVLYTGGRWTDRIWLPCPWLSVETAVRLRLWGTSTDGGSIERIEWIRSVGGAH